MNTNTQPVGKSRFQFLHDHRSCGGGCVFGPVHIFNTIISSENLFLAWGEFLQGKRNKKDVAGFSLRLSENIFNLHYELRLKLYHHGAYEHFRINDPKPRDIHKASVRDRLVHHAMYRVLYPFFDKKFVYDSYSCRLGKGTHRAMNHFRDFFRKISKNDTKTCWVLKCDIRKFFASIDHVILKNILAKHIVDADILWLLGEIIESFSTPGKLGVGLPLGNLTSQLLVNIYMNEFDQFVKHAMKQKYYIRYADDFVFFASFKEELEDIILPIKSFLSEKLKLEVHPDKMYIRTIASGFDFLGWIHFPDHRVLRTATKRRMLKRVRETTKPETIASYMGMLSHGNGYRLKSKINQIFDKKCSIR